MITVLYIDDDPAHRDIVKRYLEKSGAFTVETRESPRDVLDGKNLPGYDAIVADFLMPGMDGIEFLKQLRAAGNTIPFILFTRKGREEIVIEALNEGADFYVQKGADVKTQFVDLGHKIRVAVERRRAENAIRESENNYREIFNSTSEAIMINDARTGRVIDVNETTLRMYGYDSRKDLLLRTVGDLSADTPPYTEAEAKEWIRQSTETGPQVFEWLAKKKSGELFWTEVSLRKTDIGGTGRILSVVRDITERKAAEAALRESEERYRILADAAEDIVYIIDRDDRVTYVNRYGLELLDLKSGDILGKPRRELFPGPENERQYQAIQTVFATGKPQCSENRLPLPGREIWQDTRLVPLRSAEGTISAVMGVSRDITQRRQAAAALEESEERYRILVEHRHEGAFLEQDGKVVYCNQALSTLLGTTPDEIRKKSITDFILPEDLPRVMGQYARWYAGEDTFDSFEFTLLPADKTTKVLVALSVGAGTYRNRPASVGTIRNITREREQVRKLQESEEKIRAYIENSPVAIFVTDRDGNYTDANPAACQMTGYLRDELLALRVPDLVPEENRTGLWERLQTIWDTGLLSRELPLQKKDRTKITVMLSAVRLTDGTAVAFCVDTTKRNQAEVALRESEALFREVFNNANDAITLVKNIPGGPGKFLLVNDKITQLLGYTRDEFLQKSPSDIVPEEIMNRIRPGAMKKLFSVGDAIFESVYQRKDGTTVPVEVSIHRFLYRGEDVALGIIRDITERKAADVALRIANKKLTLLAGITRHDIRNQTLSLQAYLDLSQHSLGNTEEMRDYIAREVQIAKTIERQILFTREYEKLGVGAPVWQNIRDVVSAVTREMDLTGIEIGVNFLDGEEIFADALLKNVLHNLVDNALRHGGDGLKTIRFFSHVTSDGLVIVCEDDGIGIREDDKEMIFERGFGKNTGFGLFFIREILDITGITIRETGEPQKGARFEITAPKGTFRVRDGQ